MGGPCTPRRTWSRISHAITWSNWTVPSWPAWPSARCATTPNWMSSVGAASSTRSATSLTSWRSVGARSRAIGWNDVLVVAPYNAQVGAIRARLPAEARVGTVDKFQGQEAPISVYSMTTSAPELAPRGMDFLYSRHRLNVATSRARCISVVAMSPELLRVRARTPDQMRLANAICRYVELARTSD